MACRTDNHIRIFLFIGAILLVHFSLFGQPGIKQNLGNTSQDLNTSEIAAWEKYRRTVWTYDSNGNYTEINSYLWSKDTNKWYVNYHHDKYTYDSVGNRIEDIRWASDPGVASFICL